MQAEYEWAHGDTGGLSPNAVYRLALTAFADKEFASQQKARRYMQQYWAKIGMPQEEDD